MWSSDSEIQKMNCADSCRRVGTGGFQGCANLGKGCDFRGFYLYRYSNEGLCDECELKTFPDRYKGCASCGKAVKYTVFCRACQCGLADWLFNLFYNKNKNSLSTTSCFAIKTDDETNIWPLWQRVGTGIHCITQKYKPELPMRHRKESSMFDDIWPGFHQGDDKYVKPDPFILKAKIQIQDITWENKELVLIRELNKLKIYPHSAVQMPGTESYIESRFNQESENSTNK